LEASPQSVGDARAFIVAIPRSERHREPLVISACADSTLVVRLGAEAKVAAACISDQTFEGAEQQSAACGDERGQDWPIAGTWTLTISEVVSKLRSAERGRQLAHNADAQARRAEARRRDLRALREWRDTDQPAWLTEQSYAAEIQPRLQYVTLSRLSAALCVSHPYASKIRAGRRRPHP